MLVKPTPLQSVWSRTMSAMAVECEQFICLFILNKFSQPQFHDRQFSPHILTSVISQYAENDELWTELRHMHIADASKSVTQKFQDFSKKKKLKNTSEDVSSMQRQHHKNVDGLFSTILSLFSFLLPPFGPFPPPSSFSPLPFLLPFLMLRFLSRTWPAIFEGCLSIRRRCHRYILFFCAHCVQMVH